MKNVVVENKYIREDLEEISLEMKMKRECNACHRFEKYLQWKILLLPTTQKWGNILF